MSTITSKNVQNNWEDTNSSKKCTQIVGGDLNAELGPGYGVERTSVGRSKSTTFWSREDTWNTKKMLKPTTWSTWEATTVGCYNGLHEGVRLHHTQLNLGRPQTLRHRTWIHQPPEKQKPESHCNDWRRKRHVRDQKRDQAGWSSVELALQHCSADREEWVFDWETTITTTSRICALLTVCSYLLLQQSSFKKCCAAQKRWDSKYIQERRKILSNQSSNSRKEIDIDNIKVEMLTKESTKYLGQTNTFQQQKTTEIKNRIRAAWATFWKKTEVDIEIVSPSASSSLIRHSGHTNDELRLRNVDPHKRARKNDPIDAAQNASPLHTNEKKLQKRLKAKMKIK